MIVTPCCTLCGERDRPDLLLIQAPNAVVCHQCVEYMAGIVARWKQGDASLGFVGESRPPPRPNPGAHAVVRTPEQAQ